jgi:tRNA (guanine37-N1)-methyltransferase
MKIQVLTLFPEMFDGIFGASIIGKAQQKGIVELSAINFRDFAESKHQQVDDMPYGGGGGMVLKPEPIFRGVKHLAEKSEHQPRIILMCPQGKPFTQKQAIEWAAEQHLIFICGHYEGFDERIRQYLATDECSIGDYVLTGGEIPAMAVIDSVVRLLPRVLGNEQSAKEDSFSTQLLEYPQYTRPASFDGMDVPTVLLSGHHENIQHWRNHQSLLRTFTRRPDLIDMNSLNEQQKKWLQHMQASQEQ